MKQCPHCRETRNSDEFYECGHKWCRPCARQYSKDWKQARKHAKMAATPTRQAPELVEEMEALAHHPESGDPPAKRQRVEEDSLYLTHNPRIPGEVKIGRARNVQTRLNDLSSCQNFSLVLLQAWPGWGYLERDVHQYLASRRLTGHPGREWFRLDLAEVDLVDQLIQGIVLLRDACERLDVP